jgi:hypothetical protein
MVNVRVTGRAVPSAHIMHPLDWQGIRLQRTADGIYIWGSPAESGPERMWGLMVAQADSIAQGTGITGDFVTFIQLWIRRGVEIAVGYNSTDFVNGRKTIRAGMRVALSIYRAAAFSTSPACNRPCKASAVTPTRAVISAAASGNNTLVAAVAGRKIRVLSRCSSRRAPSRPSCNRARAAPTSRAQCRSPQTASIVMPFNPEGWCETARGGAAQSQSQRRHLVAGVSPTSNLSL